MGRCETRYKISKIVYLLCDANNFFVSCERNFNPSLNGRPVIVLSNNDGCAIARSNEAKALGIKMGDPFFKIKTLIEKEKVAVFSSNFILYGEMSNRIMSILREHVPALEVYSIDEGFGDCRGMDESTLYELGHDLSRKIRQWTGVPVSIGIAPTKTLAKIASKLCKKYPKLKGFCYMHKPEDVEKVLKKYPIEDVWGIGRQYTKMLRSYGVNTAYDFTQMPAEWVQQKMTVVGLRTWKELRGEPCIELETETPDKKQICVSRSFHEVKTEYEDLRTTVALFTSMTAEKLRRQNSVCGEVTVFVTTNRFGMDYYSDSTLIKFETPTDSTIELIKYAADGLKKIYRKELKYKKAGIILSAISPKNSVQKSFFDTIDKEKHNKLMTVIDGLNRVQGRGTLVVASQGFEGIKMNRQYLSQRYTTDWNELIKVKDI